MQLTRLRLVGFKTFVDPSEIVIQPGLSGIVGPNGCGKSNLVEALRWVMGENSYKALRASEMDDVIFAGSANRPGRNTAEVSVWLDNSDHRAPPPFTDMDELEISRRIEREKGSVYRVNGKDMRARDVQLMFADASTGARSPSMVRQGQIAEIISARPESRRRVLEEAAGISGLHTRRQEAEQRLKTAEQNLQRVEDILLRLNGQLEGLRRQSRQALRYKNLSAEIRQCERAILRQTLAEAQQEFTHAQSAVAEAERQVADCLLRQHGSAKDEAVAQHDLKRKREEAQAALAALERVKRSRDDLVREEEQTRQRLVELERQKMQLTSDIAREETLEQDARTNLERISRDQESARKNSDAFSENGEKEQHTIAVTAQALTEIESALSAATAAVAERNARRDSLMRSRMDAEARIRRMHEEIASVSRDIAQLDQTAAAADWDSLNRAHQLARHALGNAEQHVVLSEYALQEAQEAETAHRPLVHESEKKLRHYEVEIRTLTRMLSASSQGEWAPLLDSVSVERGYERAFAAAFGEETQTSLDTAAPLFWADTPALANDPSLPEGIESLSRHVTAPQEITRRLAQTGLVTAEQGTALQSRLATGQCLVSLEGDMWRWDGYTVTRNAASPAAIRLAERNRLQELENTRTEAESVLAAHQSTLQELEAKTRQARTQDQESRARTRDCRLELDRVQAQLVKAESEKNQREARRSALSLNLEHLQSGLGEAESALALTLQEFESLPESHDLEDNRDQIQQRAEKARMDAANARAALESFRQRKAGLERRLTHLEDERKLWEKRSEEAANRLHTLQKRHNETDAEYTALSVKPEELALSRQQLQDSLQSLTDAEKIARDALSLAEKQHSDSGHAAREALRLLGDVQTALARAEERRETARERLDAVQIRFDETHRAAPLLDNLSDAEPSQQQPQNLHTLNTKLDQLRLERERLGAVNLRAEEELKEAQNGHGQLEAEQTDLREAIRKLRHGLNTLNQEGRERLLAAFTAVNTHFIRLFSSLFGGGEAHLQLIEAEDPLAIGLEVIARPPGKRPQTLSLLSGGEQALTAMALIFAIFLTNPAPICVLDEVDAPLDDANVERFCDLLESMREETDTRFLVITHNPVTMSRMDRLFGVTMAERGVSQLVSVNLQEAENLLEVI